MLLGETTARGKHRRFGIKASDRMRHIYLIGKTGMGKSTLLENLAIQDIRRGAGVTFVDPHGASAERLLAFIPRERVRDVIYFAPFDLEHPIAFNVLEKVDRDKRHLIVSSLMATFEKIWVDAWSARMAYILQNTLSALLEYPNATLLGVNRMYVDNEFRKHVIEHITDPAVKAFWKDEFAKYTDRYTAEATPAIQNKIGQFAANAMIRNIIGQPHTAFDLRRVMDERKILIVNLSKGRVGEDNARLLGAMLVTKLYLAAMSRADTAPEDLAQLPPHYLYVDEFQSFANRTFADILSEARKYKLSLTIAHQYIEQMEDEIRAAVFGNVGTLLTFRVGAYDAEVLEREFGPRVTAQDLVNLGFAETYVRLMVDGVTTPPFSARTLPPMAQPAEDFRAMVLASSRAQWARDRKVVEEEVRMWHAPVTSEATKLKQERRQLRRQLRQQLEGEKKEAEQAAQGQQSDSKDTQPAAPSLTPSHEVSLRELLSTLVAELERRQAPAPPKGGVGGETLRELLARVQRIEAQVHGALQEKQAKRPTNQRADPLPSKKAATRGPVGLPLDQLKQLLTVEEYDSSSP